MSSTGFKRLERIAAEMRRADRSLTPEASIMKAYETPEGKAAADEGERPKSTPPGSELADAISAEARRAGMSLQAYLETPVGRVLGRAYDRERAEAGV